MKRGVIRRIALLAGGRARRMGGRAKGLIEIDGAPIITRLAAIGAALSAEVVLVGDHAGAYAPLGLPIIPDAIPDRGPPGGVHSALRDAPGWTAVLALDLPFIDAAFLDALFSDGPEDAILPFCGRLQPLAGCWHPRAVPTMERLLADARPGFERICAALQVRRVPWPDPRPFTNLNTPDDVARLTGEPPR